MKFFQKANKSLFLAFSLICLLAAHLATAQQVTQPKRSVDELSDEEIALFMERAQASGMSELQIEQMAKTQGYTASDISKMRERIASVEASSTNSPASKSAAIDPMNGSSLQGVNSMYQNSAFDLDNQRMAPSNLNKKRSTIVQPSKNYLENPLTIEERKILAKPLDIYNDSLVASYKNVQKKLSNVLDKKVFGANLFQTELLTFEPDMRIATPKNYQLGPDDELNIAIFGDVLDYFKVKVSPEGTVKILNIAPIYVNGLTIEVASERIISRLRQLYQGLNKPGSGSSAQVTLGNVRSIKVTLTGEVTYPGTYTVSSLATVFNALYVAGGPSKNGSFRTIRVIRGNKVVRTLD